MFCVFFGKKNAAFKLKDIISGFPVSPGSAEALVRWGRKMKYVLIGYFWATFCQKLLQSNGVCKDYSKSKVGRFLRHSVEASDQMLLITHADGKCQWRRTKPDPTHRLTHHMGRVNLWVCVLVYAGKAHLFRSRGISLSVARETKTVS